MADAYPSSRSRLAGLVHAIEVHTGFETSAIRGTQNAPRAIYTIQFAAGTLQGLGRKLWCSGTRRQNQWRERKDEKPPHVATSSLHHHAFFLPVQSQQLLPCTLLPTGPAFVMGDHIIVLRFQLQ